MAPSGRSFSTGKFQVVLHRDVSCGSLPMLNVLWKLPRGSGGGYTFGTSQYLEYDCKYQRYTRGDVCTASCSIQGIILTTRRSGSSFALKIASAHLGKP